MDSYDALRMSNSAYVISQAIAANIELSAMVTENALRAKLGMPQEYTSVDMMELISKYGLGHNAVITTLNHGL